MMFDNELSSFIDTTILRYSSENGSPAARYVINLRHYQSRITDKLVNECLSACDRMGLTAERIGDAVFIDVNLNRCTFSSRQAREYQTAVNYRRTIHGHDL